MKRVTFYEPPGGYTPETVSDALSFVWPGVPREQVNGWSELELVVAYDWAMREHLHAAGNSGVRRRERPSFLGEYARACLTGCELLARPSLQFRDGGPDGD